MQTVPIDQLEGQILGNSRLERFLGQGHMNAVYQVRNLSSQRMDALTFYLVPQCFSSEMRARFLARFLTEAASVASLKHAHILPVYEYGEYFGRSYLVTPYMMHGSLADRLKKNGRYNYMSVLSLLEQLIAGLSYAHQRHFFHGTLKPANIVLRSDDSMQIAGFGLMHMLQLRGLEPGGKPGNPDAHLLSMAGTFLAAPEYVAPEIVQGQSIDERSDVYALGCILFELLSGQPPFSGNDPLEVARSHTEQGIPSLRTFCPDVPIALVSVINQALVRNPMLRFQDVRDLGEAFTQAAQGATGPLPCIVNGVIASNRQQTRLQETPQNENKWQLMPPIVTGKMMAINLGDQNTPLRRLQAAEQMEHPSSTPTKTTTGLRPLLPSSAPPTIPNFEHAITMPPTPRQNDIYQLERREQTALHRVPAPLPTDANALPGTSENTSDLVKAYSWWSPSEAISPPPQHAQDRRQVPPREPLPLGSPEAVHWTTGPFLSDVVPAPHTRITRADKISRRSALTLMATGAVVAAGAVVGLNLGAFAPLFANKNVQFQTAQGNTDIQQKTGNGDGQQKAGNGQPAAGNGQQGHTGTVVGQSNQMLNTAIDFKNPADNQQSLLIHLAENTFVAYEQACTHQGVLVNYNSVTKKLVCPAHGAIFDPANKGTVLLGPNGQPASTIKPLPTVIVMVNNDGTITI